MNPGSCRLDISATACRWDIVVFAVKSVNPSINIFVRSCNYKSVVDEYKSWCEECSDWVSGKTGHDGNNGLRMIQEEPGEENYSTRRSSLQRFTDSLEIADRSYRQPWDDWKMEYLGFFSVFLWVIMFPEERSRFCALSAFWFFSSPASPSRLCTCGNIANNGN